MTENEITEAALSGFRITLEAAVAAAVAAEREACEEIANDVAGNTSVKDGEYALHQVCLVRDRIRARAKVKK